MPFSNRSFLDDPLSASQNKEYVLSFLCLEFIPRAEELLNTEEGRVNGLDYAPNTMDSPTFSTTSRSACFGDLHASLLPVPLTS